MGKGSAARLPYGGTMSLESSHFLTLGRWDPEKQIQIIVLYTNCKWKISS